MNGPMTASPKRPHSEHLHYLQVFVAGAELAQYIGQLHGCFCHRKMQLQPRITRDYVLCLLTQLFFGSVKAIEVRREVSGHLRRTAPHRPV
jgi:hypothetical protein